MKKYLLLYFISFISFSDSFSQTNQTKFQLVYNWGPSGNLFFIGMGTKNSTNGYISMGWGNNSSSDLFPTGYAFETDTMGNVLWARKYKGDNTFGFTPLTIADFIKSGTSYVTTGQRSSNAMLMKLGPTGTVTFDTQYGSGWGSRLKEDVSANIAVAGASDAKTMNPDKDSTSIYVFKTNAGGTYQWGRSYTLNSPVFDSHDAAYDVATVSDGYVFTGYHSENNAGDTTTNIILFKTDFSGTLMWMKSFGTISDNESGQRILYDAANNQFIIMGQTSAASVFGDICLTRTDASGNIISSTAYGTNAGVAISDQLVFTSDGGFAIIGWAAVFAVTTYKPFIVKLNSSFGHQWTKYYNPTTLGGFFSYGEEATNGGYIFSNLYADMINGGWANELIKTDSQGKTDNTNTSCSETNYVPVQRTYAPPAKTITPTVHISGSGSSFTSGNSAFTPAKTVVCMICAKPSASISASPSSTICAGNSATLTATGGGTYLWNTGATSPAIVVSPTITTVYTATVSSGGCDSIVPFTITVTGQPSASISGNTNICVGQTTTLTAAGGGTYSWWNNGTTSATITDTPAGTTTYTVTVTNAAGCTNTGVTTVTVNSLPTASISGSTNICAGDMATLTASGGGTYSWWNNGATSATITDSPASNTTYTVTVSNGACTSTTTSLVTVNSLPSASISGNTNLCQGSSTTLTASGGGTYSWDNSAITASITVNPSSTTSYTVYVTSASGCTATAVTTVNVAPPPVAVVSGNNTICSGQSTVLSASGGLTYSWNTTATTSSITVSPTTTITYSVIASAGSCSDTTSVTVTVNSSPTANINTASTSICSGQSATLTAAGGGTYSWNTGATTNPIIVSPTSASSYSVIVSNGLCTDTASVNISVNAPVVAGVASAGTSTICSGISATLTASGGTNYSWSTGSTINPIIVSPSTGTTYSVIVSNGTCSDTASINISVNTSPTPSVSATSNSICEGQSATLTASGGGTYVWNPGGQTTNIISVSPTTNANYTVTVTATNGCTASATSSVAVTPVPNPVANSSSGTICSGDATTLTASGGTTYVWNPGNQSGATVVVNPTSATNYTVTASNGNCSSAATVSVNVNPSPSAAAANVSVNYGNTTTISVTPSGGTPPYTYLWNTGDVTQTITVSPSATTVYCVTITDANGCSDTACATVTVDYNCGELFIPNAFSPNGDLKNDYFRPRSICFKSFKLIVYDRWGVNVFETEDITTKGWDGMYKGKIGETAVFSYYFTYELVDGSSGVKKGTVSLIR